MALEVKIKSITKLYDDISEYIGSIQLKKAKIDLDLDIDEELKEMQTVLKKIKTASKSDPSLELSFSLWHYINLAAYKIDNLVSELDNLSNTPRLTAEMTDTHIKLIGDLFNNITALYSKYQKDSAQLDPEIIVAMTKDIKSCSESIQESAELIKKWPFALSLFAYIMQKNLDECPKLQDDIDALIEDVKDHILVSDKLSKQTARLFAQNPHIKTFGLTPYGPSKKLADWSDELGIKDKLSVSKLSAVAKSKKWCIVVLNRVIRKPIEFSLWNLMDWKYAKSYMQSNQDGGINEKLVERFDTVAFIDAITRQKWDFEIKHYGDLDNEHFVVFERLSDAMYRLLALYTDRDVVFETSGGALNTKIPRGKIPEFINYVKNKGQLASETRTSKYHQIQEKQIVQNMFLPVKFNIEGINLSSQIVDSRLLRTKLFIQLNKRCNELIGKSASKIKTHKDVAQIIHDEELSDIFNSIIVEQYDDYVSKNKDKVSDFAFSETLKTFLAQLQHLNRNFMRNMHDNFIATKIDDKIFEPSATRDRTIFLQKMCEDIIKKTLEKLISNESNVYQGLIYKNSLLKLSVV